MGEFYAARVLIFFALYVSIYSHYCKCNLCKYQFLREKGGNKKCLDMKDGVQMSSDAGLAGGHTGGGPYVLSS